MSNKKLKELHEVLAEKLLEKVKDPDAKNLYDSLGITTINQAALVSNQLAEFVTQES